MRAIQKLDEAREKLEETNKEFDNARRKAKTAKMSFERIKQERYDLFMKVDPEDYFLRRACSS